MAETERIPLWLDCDPGHDDAFAILVAAAHPRLKLLGVSTVHGNASLAQVTHNARSILMALGRDDIPVFPGARAPFCRGAVHAPDIHGGSGINGTTLLPEPTTPARTGGAVLAMYNALRDTPERSAWVVATGALTNVALLFASFPELIPRIKGLSVMGGALGEGFSDAPMGHVHGEGARLGNFTSWAEFNIYCDPEAAASLFSHPTLAAKTTLIPLDLTHQVLATPSVQDLLLYGAPGSSSFSPLEEKAQPSRLRRMLHDLLTFFARTYAEVFGLTAGPPLHDPLAVAVLLSPEIGFRYAKRADSEKEERWTLRVITDGAHGPQEGTHGREDALQTGRTIAMPACGGSEAEEEGVRIPRAVDVSQFWTVLEECVARAERGGVFN
ncbi:MAG: Uridine nucleosidase 1 [Thelocarpon impressellum]|nr:MAG: Uridine nucleosidase 1 [Thelocarpon impressellum]